MVLSTCFRCGNQVSNSATSCPKCRLAKPWDHLYWYGEWLLVRENINWKIKKSQEKINVVVKCPDCNSIIFSAHMSTTSPHKLNFPLQCQACGCSEIVFPQCQCGKKAYVTFMGEYYCSDEILLRNEHTYNNVEIGLCDVCRELTVAIMQDRKGLHPNILNYVVKYTVYGVTEHYGYCPKHNKEIKHCRSSYPDLKDFAEKYPEIVTLREKELEENQELAGKVKDIVEAPIKREEEKTRQEEKKKQQEIQRKEEERTTAREHGFEIITVKGEDVVFDQKTGLMWQRYLKKELSHQGDTAKLKTQGPENAKSSAGKLTIGGYSDWRLPTKKELLSLSKKLDTIPETIFPGLQNAQVWSSDIIERYPGGMREVTRIYVDFSSGKAEGTRTSVDHVFRFHVRKEDDGKKGGCYIATMVYGSYDAPEVIVLRRFRDNCLAKSLFGKFFIQVYYFLSPRLVWLLGTHQSVSRLLKVFIDKMVFHLINKEKIL